MRKAVCFGMDTVEEEGRLYLEGIGILRLTIIGRIGGL